MSERQRTAELHDPRSALGVLPGDGLERLCMTNLLTSVEDRVYFKDRGSRFLFVSAGWLEAYAPLQQLKEVLGKTDHDIFSAEHADVARADERRIMSTGEPMIAHIVRETYRDRPDSWAHVTKRALRDERGQIVGTWGITRDVTPQVEAEQALRASRAELEASESMRHIMFEGNPQPVFVVDRATMRIVGVNAAAEDRYGYSREEFLAMAITDLWPAEDAAAYLASPSPRADMYLLGFRVGQPLRHVLRDGTITDVEITSKNAIFEGRECRVTSVHDVTERNRAAIELSAARDEAVEASNLKSAFLATISHEIRTPMNGVLGMTELLLDTELDEEQRMLADQVARSGELMLALISDILDISKIEAGQLDVEEVDYALRDTIEQACVAAKFEANAKGVGFSVAIADEVPEQALGDGRRLRQILLNLVSNAVKFTSEGAISVTASALGAGERTARLRIEVTDTGIGIAAAALERMFEPFTQADASTTRNFGGTGLGLSIARELTELMGGTMDADSESGSGSTFWIELPLRTAPAPTAKQASTARATATLNWSSPPSILVVEDSPVNQIVATRTLERCGCRAEVAGDGRRALEMLAAYRYDAVLMDCQMPGMDGYNATIELRRRETRGNRVPVIAMTARAMDGDRERCLEAGMDDFVTKPIRRAELIKTLREWLPELTS